MDMKDHILSALRDEFERWEGLLAGMSEQEITARRLPSDLSIKDVLAHLWAWQQRSIARLEAACLNRDPQYPEWATGLDPDSEASTEQANAWIHEAYLNQPWEAVHQNWKEGFDKFLQLGADLSEEDLLEKDYPWLGGYALYMILVSSYSHHRIEHYLPLVAWLQEHGRV